MTSTELSTNVRESLQAKGGKRASRELYRNTSAQWTSAGSAQSVQARRLSRHVNWSATIERAVVEVLSFDAESDISVPLQYVEDPSCCSRLCTCCRQFFLGDDPAPPQYGRSQTLTNLANARPLKDGTCWKLNSGVDLGCTKNLADLQNWRRRRFFMQRSEGKLALLYISEKDDGTMQLGCILDDLKVKQPAAIQEMPIIQMTPLDTYVKMEIARNLHEYDLAFAEKEKYYTNEAYVEDIPESLYPVEIKWKDSSKQQQVVCIAFDTVKERKVWLNSMRMAMNMLGI